MTFQCGPGLHYSVDFRTYGTGQGRSQNFCCGGGGGLSHQGAENESRKHQGRAKGEELRCVCAGAGVSLPSGGEVGEGAVPHPQKFFRYFL